MFIIISLLILLIMYYIYFIQCLYIQILISEKYDYNTDDNEDLFIIF